MDKVNYSTSATYLTSVPVPATTNTYKAISHRQLIDLTLEAIDKEGMEVQNAIYTQARDGKHANGRYVIKSPDSEMNIMVGWQNSYDKTISLKFAVGAHIFICSNGAISGDMGAFKKKHKGNVQEFTPATIGEYIRGAGETFYNIQRDRDAMKNELLTPRVTAELIGRMFIEEDIITSTQLNIIKREIEAPTHDYNAPGSMWELYNYSTFAAKQEHPTKFYDTHMNIHKFFKEQLV